MAMLAGDFTGQAQLFFPGTKNAIPGNNIASLMTADGKAIANVYRTMSSQSGATFVNQAVSNNLTLFPLNPLNFPEDIVLLDYRINVQHTVYSRWPRDAN